MEEASDHRVVQEDVDVAKVAAARTAEHSRQVQPICSKTKLASPCRTQTAAVVLWHSLKPKQHNFHQQHRAPK